MLSVLPSGLAPSTGMENAGAGSDARVLSFEAPSMQTVVTPTRRAANIPKREQRGDFIYGVNQGTSLHKIQAFHGIRAWHTQRPMIARIIGLVCNDGTNAVFTVPGGQPETVLFRLDHLLRK